jgi:hypothetical protein
LTTVVRAANQDACIGLVLADAELDSEEISQAEKKSWRVHGVRVEMRRAFLRRFYRKRALVETLFSSMKCKLSARARGRMIEM